MQTLKLDNNNNLVITDSKDLKIIDEIEAFSQNIRTHLGLIKGENIFNIDEGIEYFDEILGKLGGVEYLKYLIRNRILEHPEVVEVENVEITKDNNDTAIIETSIISIYSKIYLQLK
jgi:hypothetical protein